MNSQYNRQLEHDAYVQNQRQNYTDLSVNLENPNDSVKIFSNILFNKPLDNLSSDMTGMLLDEEMDVIDIFQTFLEIVIYGLDILTNSSVSLFDLTDQFNDMIYTLKTYTRAVGFDIVIEEEIVEKDRINLYRDRTDYYCQITPKPHPYFCFDGWYVSNYRCIVNSKFVFDKDTCGINDLKAFFISKSRQIFTVKFVIHQKMV